jgi:hypothetical protein
MESLTGAVTDFCFSHCAAGEVLDDREMPLCDIE